MKNYITTISLIILVLLSHICIASTADSASFLKIGDKVPDIEFKIKNYSKPTAKISDFKGKLVILDLWGVTCGSCIAAMPHMAELQKKFEGKIQVILVTKDSGEKVAKLALRSDNVKMNKLPSVTNGKELAGLFDYQTYPTHIWIDENGMVQHIAYGSAANESNIRSFLEGQKLNLKQKKDLHINTDDPLLVSWYPYHNEISFYSYLAPKQREYSASASKSLISYPDGIIKRLYNGAASLLDLYKLSYGIHPNSKFSDDRVINLSKDSLMYKVDTDKPFYENEFYYVYDVINGTKISNNKLFKHMQNELNTMFNLSCKMEKRKIRVLVLKVKDGYQKIYAKGGQLKGDKSKGNYIVENLKWSIASEFLNNDSPYEFIDETNIPLDQTVNLKFSLKWHDIQQINKSIENSGLFLEWQTKMYDCIVLNDAN